VEKNTTSYGSRLDTRSSSEINE